MRARGVCSSRGWSDLPSTWIPSMRKGDPANRFLRRGGGEGAVSRAGKRGKGTPPQGVMTRNVLGPLLGGRGGGGCRAGGCARAEWVFVPVGRLLVGRAPVVRGGGAGCEEDRDGGEEASRAVIFVGVPEHRDREA